MPIIIGIILLLLIPIIFIGHLIWSILILILGTIVSVPMFLGCIWLAVVHGETPAEIARKKAKEKSMLDEIDQFVHDTLDHKKEEKTKKRTDW